MIYVRISQSVATDMHGNTLPGIVAVRLHQCVPAPRFQMAFQGNSSGGYQLPGILPTGLVLLPEESSALQKHQQQGTAQEQKDFGREPLKSW